MSKAILIVLFLVGNEPAITSIEFDKRSACKAAVSMITADYEAQGFERTVFEGVNLPSLSGGPWYVKKNARIRAFCAANPKS